MNKIPLEYIPVFLFECKSPLVQVMSDDTKPLPEPVMANNDIRCRKATMVLL